MKPSGCVNPYHPPECPRIGPPGECARTLDGLIVLTEKEWGDLHAPKASRKAQAEESKKIRRDFRETMRHLRDLCLIAPDLEGPNKVDRVEKEVLSRLIDLERILEVLE